MECSHGPGSFLIAPTDAVEDRSTDGPIQNSGPSLEEEGSAGSWMAKTPAGRDLHMRAFVTFGSPSPFPKFYRLIDTAAMCSWSSLSLLVLLRESFPSEYTQHLQGLLGLKTSGRLQELKLIYEIALDNTIRYTSPDS